MSHYLGDELAIFGLMMKGERQLGTAVDIPTRKIYGATVLPFYGAVFEFPFHLSWSLELFVGDGATVFTLLHYSDPANSAVMAEADNGHFDITGTIWPLQSIWT